MLVEIINFSKNVLVSCALVQLQFLGNVLVEVPQISSVKQNIYNVAESFTVWLAAQNRDFF